MNSINDCAKIKERGSFIQSLHVSNERQLSRLINKIFLIDTVEDFVRLVGMQSSKVGEIVLCFQSAYFGPRQYCLRKERFYERSPKKFWPRVLEKRIQYNKDSFYLANELGRPFHKILSLPLSDCEKQAPALFVEYFSKDQVIIDAFCDEKWEILQSAFSKILLEEHWRTGCLLWEQTFDGLDEPLVIFDKKKQPVLSNTHFKKLYEKNPDMIKKNSFQDGNNVYEKQSYPVFNNGESYVIEHFVSMASYLLLKEQMAQNQRMSLLGQLADDVVHNLNNPLTGLCSMAQILCQYSGNEELRKNFIEIETTVQRCQNIVKNFVQFSKKSGFDIVCDLHEITRQTLPFLKTIIHSKRIQLELDKNQALVKAEPCLLQQVIFNLIKNALQAVDENGKIEIKSIVNAEKIYWSITDNGCGISLEHQDQLFNPFFTTKSEGTGLGLRISHQWIEKFGGKLEFKSQKGQGSCFTFFLPRIKNEQTKSKNV